jgi:ankyrin repeat protein
MLAASAGSLPCAQLLLAAGADPAARDGFGATAQLRAVEAGFDELLRVLEARQVHRLPPLLLGTRRDLEGGGNALNLGG